MKTWLIKVLTPRPRGAVEGIAYDMQRFGEPYRFRYSANFVSGEIAAQ